ncbi:methyl-CpG-binding domain-containing protein 13 isoform X2 [Punica granatum]|uniref:Methyl-CpG-binding domain-containing protein 13 isoform X2 n=1 Tax=Punica granatum TaxID=22663 RepID=A0A6P8CC70_PUNGR|nr:methyl-CpG-binding domain-containing protein 13 isoform X2 [Punica granatum]
MADQSSDDWLPAGWTVNLRVRPSGKKDKHYFAPSGHKFYSKAEVTRYLKTVPCSPPQSKEEKGAIVEESAEDASADAVQKDSPNPQEKGKLGLELFSQNHGSPESEEKFYSAEETAEDDCGNATQSGSLNSEDKENAKRDQPAEICAREDKALAVDEYAQNVCDSPMDEAKSNLEQSTENRSSPRFKEVKNVDHEESADQICGNAAENGSHQSKEEEKDGRDACDHVKQACSSSPKEKKKTRAKQSGNVSVERGVAEGLPDGWIKEIKVTKKKNVVRRDPYYIDPVSGYIFRSMKDALRYVATGDIGRLAFKRKDKGDSDAELEDAKSSSPSAIKSKKLDENGIITEDQRSKRTEQQNLDENGTSAKDENSIQHAGATDGQVRGSADVGGAKPGVSVPDLSGSNLPKLRERTEGRNNTDGTNLTPANEAGVPRDVWPLQKTGEVPALADKAAVPRDEMRLEKMEDMPATAEASGVPQDDQPPKQSEKTPPAANECGVLRAEQCLGEEETPEPADEAGIPQDEQCLEMTEEAVGNKTTPQGTPKSRKRKLLDLPRRTSSRLAGVAVDPNLEVTGARVLRTAIRRLDEGEASGVKSVSPDAVDPSLEVTRTRALRTPTGRLGEGEASGVKSVTTNSCGQLQPLSKRTRRGNKLSDSMTRVGPSEAVLEEDANKVETDQAEAVTTRGRCQLQPQTKRARRGNKLLDSVNCAGPSEAVLQDNADKLERNRAEGVTATDCCQLQPHTKRTRRGNKLAETITSVAPSEAVLEEDADKHERDRADDKKKGKSTLSSPQENIFAANHAEKPRANEESEEKPMLPFELPSGDILSDPCIEFAIKTLTGIDFDTSKNTPKSSNDSNVSRDVASLKVKAEHMEIEREINKQQAPPDKSTSKACNYEEKAGSEIPGSSLSNLPFGDSWQDPCIEFAIKTLTGAIPVEYDLDIPDLMRQQIRSSQIQESSEVALSNVGLDNFCRTDLLWQHSGDASSDKTAHRQQSGVIPIAQQPGNNVDLHRKGGAVLRQHRQDRGNKYQR